jgi:hypothetical protein
MIYRERQVGNGSIAHIYGPDWETIKSNRFFVTYTYDKKYEVVLGDMDKELGRCGVFLRRPGEDDYIHSVIGWLYENGKAPH